MTGPAEQVTRDFLGEHLREVPPFRALIRAIECRLFAELGPLEPPVLDIGCGDGHFAATAYGASPNLGIDVDRRSLIKARDRGAHRLVIAASATEIPAPAASFAAVVSNCVIEHIPDLDGVLREVGRVLRPGGRFAFGVPSHRFADLLLGSTILRHLGASRLAGAYGDWFNDHSRHYHTYPPEFWQMKLDQHEFDVRSWTYYMTAAGHRAFDVAHYLSLPNLVSYRLTGRWVLWHNSLTQSLLDQWLRPHYESACPADGAYLFFDCRKR